MATIHSIRVKRKGDIALPIDGDDAPVAAEFRELLVDHDIARFLYRLPFVGHESRDVMGNGKADKVLTGAGAGNSTGAVVGVCPGPDDR